MLTNAILGIAILLGYTATVLTSMVTTMGIAAGAPQVVVRDYRIRGRYKFLHEALWFFSAVLGGFVTSMASMGMAEWKAKLGLSAVLLLVMWRNSWEARQRGTAHQILISLLTVAGVLCGYAYRSGSKLRPEVGGGPPPTPLTFAKSSGETS